MIPRFWQKTSTCPADISSFPSSENLDVVSQDHLGFFKVVNCFFHKIMFFLTTFAITSWLFWDRAVKHGIICFTEMSFSCKTFKIWSKVPYMIFMGLSSNWTWWFQALEGRNYIVVLIVIGHFKIGLSQSHLTLFVVMLKLKLKIWSWKKPYTTYSFKACC